MASASGEWRRLQGDAETWPGADLELVLRILRRANVTLWAGRGKEDDFAIRLWGPGAERVYGYMSDEAVGRSYIDLFVSPEEKDRAIEDHARIIETDEVYNWDWAAGDIPKDQIQKTMLTHCFRVQDPADGTWLLAEMGIDISDFNRASQELRRLREEDLTRLDLEFMKSLEAIGSTVASQIEADATIEPVVEQVLDAVGKATRFNARATVWLWSGDVLERVKDSPAGPNAFHPFAEADATEFVAKMRQSIYADANTAEPAGVERFRQHERRGRKRTFFLAAMGDVGVLGLSLATGEQLPRPDRERLEILARHAGILIPIARQIEQNRKAVARDNAAVLRQRFFRGVMHGVGNKVTVLQENAQLLEQESARARLSEGLRERVLTLGSQIENLREYFEQFRREQQSGFSLESVAVRPVAEQVVRHLKVDYRDVRFEIRCPDGAEVQGIRTWLEQIIENLVSNAAQIVQAVDEGGDVLITVRDEGTSDVSIDVEDSGPNIDPSIRATLFERGVTKRRGGTGEGLFQAKDWVEILSGSLEVLQGSRNLGGAHFRVTLPSGANSEG